MAQSAMSLAATRPRPVRPRRRTAAVIEAAAEVFAERGYHGASTQDIADRLGMRQASLYYYFPSKEAALELVCKRGVEGYVERALEIAKGAGGVAEKLAAMCRQNIESGGSRPTFSRAFLRERRFLPTESRRRIGRLARRYERIIEGIIAAGIASGELRADIEPRLATLALLGMCNTAVDWIGKEPGATVERVAQSFSHLILDGLIARRQR
jgi:TetR/AcrR family transcriptional regulator, cholesterol catabolism regulator